ncbi:MAG: glycosyltransferase family 2 protein [Microscillaceae bacterium]
MTDYPKISIVSPSYNQGQYLEETILSVIGQNYPNLEYIIIDGGSTDNSLEIIKKYEKHLAYWVSEPDQGMYEAIQKGFEKSSGEIMAWINSDDMLHRKGLFSVAEIFLSFPQIEWIQAALTGYDEQGRTIGVSKAIKWSKFKFYLDCFGAIQQENSLWRRSLWEKAGACMDTQFKYAGDYELWSRFFRFASPYSADVLFGGFRMRRNGQISKIYKNDYFKEAALIIAREKRLLSASEQLQLKKLHFWLRLSRRLENVGLCFLRAKLDRLYQTPPRIIFNSEKQLFELDAIAL